VRVSSILIQPSYKPQDIDYLSTYRTAGKGTGPGLGGEGGWCAWGGGGAHGWGGGGGERGGDVRGGGGWSAGGEGKREVRGG